MKSEQVHMDTRQAPLDSEQAPVDSVRAPVETVQVLQSPKHRHLGLVSIHGRRDCIQQGLFRIQRALFQIHWGPDCIHMDAS